MPQETTPEPETDTNMSPATPAEPERPSKNHSRHHRRDVPFVFSTRDFEGATPNIAGVLGLHSESITKKMSYDSFLENLGTCIMAELKRGEHTVEVTTQTDFDIIVNVETLHKIEELTDEEKELSVERKMKKE